MFAKKLSKLNQIKLNFDNGIMSIVDISDIEAFSIFVLRNEQFFIENNDIKFSPRPILNKSNDDKEKGFTLNVIVTAKENVSINIVNHVIKLELDKYNKFVEKRNQAIDNLESFNDRIF